MKFNEKLQFGSIIKLKYNGSKHKFRILGVNKVIQKGDICTDWLYSLSNAMWIGTEYVPYCYEETLEIFLKELDNVKLFPSSSIGETPSDEHTGRIYLRPIN